MAEPAFESVETTTQAEFARFIEGRERIGDVYHYELLNGRIVMTPPAGYPHSSIAKRLLRRIDDHVTHNRLGEVFESSQGYDLPSGDTVEPDVSYVSNERLRAGPAPVEGAFLRIVPDLVVEVRSTRTASHDRGEKKAIYERNGVREYWIADGRGRTTTRFVLRDVRFDGGTMYGDGESVASEGLPGLSIAVAEVFTT